MKKHMLTWKQLNTDSSRYKMAKRMQCWNAIKELKKQKNPGKSLFARTWMSVIAMSSYLFVITMAFYQFTN